MPKEFHLDVTLIQKASTSKVCDKCKNLMTPKRVRVVLKSRMVGTSTYRAVKTWEVCNSCYPAFKAELEKKPICEF